MSFTQICDERRDEVGHDSLHGSHRNPPTEARMVAKLLRGVLDFEKDTPRALQERCPRFGQHRLAPQAVEQFMTDLRFQLQNLLAKRWLRHMRPGCRAGEVLGIGDRDEVAKLM